MDSQLNLTRKYLKFKLTEDNITFTGHREKMEYVYNLLKGSILQGESDSALLIGPRGCGKTTLINAVISKLSKELDLYNDSYIIKLNGLIHHNEKVALKAIATQMQLDNVVGDKIFGTFAENLQYLLNCIISGNDKQSKSIVFILDEFDLFCHSGKMQMLLYNLFDITHNRLAPMCVFGITTKIDIMESLEKRVKSRFSHRIIHLYPNNQETTILANFQETFKSLLSLPLKRSRKRKDNVAYEEYSLHEDVIQKCGLKRQEFEFDQKYVEKWNAHIDELLSDDCVIDTIEKFCYYSNNIQIFRDVLYQIVSRLSTTLPCIKASDISSAIDNMLEPEQGIAMLQSLSILELSLVIAMKHGAEIFGDQPMNFEMVLHRYSKFANKHSSTQNMSRAVIQKAFEHLEALEIIIPVKSMEGITANRVQKEYQLFKLSLPLEDVETAVKQFKSLPTEIMHWFNDSEI